MLLSLQYKNVSLSSVLEALFGLLDWHYVCLQPVSDYSSNLVMTSLETPGRVHTLKECARESHFHAAVMPGLLQKKKHTQTHKSSRKRDTNALQWLYPLKIQPVTFFYPFKKLPTKQT